LPVFPEETAAAVVGDATAADDDDDDLVPVTVVEVEDDSAFANTADTLRITKDLMPVFFWGVNQELSVWL
ncbi:hypothetical protein HK100_009162, partial [Physocladia obscura]